MSKETPEEQNTRIDSMLKDMVVETFVYSVENDEDFPGYTREQIGDFCGCSKDTIRRIEQDALDHLRELLK